MNSIANLYFNSSSRNEIASSNPVYAFILKFSVKNERKLLKAFLLGRLHKFFCELFFNTIPNLYSDYLTESYTMDSKIIQLLIQGIIETGEYTLEGIANYTRVPFDVIFDAACGNNSQFSITLWARVVDLYIQVKPEVAQMLFDKLQPIKDKNLSTLSLLINEQ